MARIYSCTEELIGNTPLVEFTHIAQKYNLKSRILAKLEYLNPTGSVKDRAAKEIIDDAERKGLLQPGGTVIEPTSGNTGIGLAAIAAVRGYRMIIVIPDSMSVERRNIIKAYGAEIVLTDGKLGMKGAIEKAEEIKSQTPGSIIAGQFVNYANVQAHINTTGPEIWKDTDGEVDVFVAGVGTGGTLTGVGEYLKKNKSCIKIVAVEPEDSPVLSQGKSGAHGIQGIGSGFVPDILNTEIYDEVITVNTEQAINMAKEIAHTEGVLVGISSGAALFAAIEIAKKYDDNNIVKNIVVLLPDSGDRYYSTTLFTE